MAAADSAELSAQLPVRPSPSGPSSTRRIGHASAKSSAPARSPSNAVKLRFDSESESDSESDLDAAKANREREHGLRINKKYAKRFEAKERRNDLFRAKSKGLLDDDSDSESEDEKAEALTPALELDIMKTISMIKTKDKRIYDKAFKAFKEKEMEGDENDESDEGDTRKKGKRRKMTYKDMVREDALKKMETGDVDLESEPEEEDLGGTSKGAKIAYNAEQRELKAAFKSAAESEEEEEEKEEGEGEEEEEEDFVTLKPKSEAQVAKEEDEFKQYVADLRKKATLSHAVSENLDTLEKAFGQRSKDDGEEFLRQYVLQRKWAKDTDDEEDDDDSGGGKDVDDSVRLVVMPLQCVRYYAEKWMLYS